MAAPKPTSVPEQAGVTGVVALSAGVRSWREWLSRYWILVTLAILVVISSLLSDSFLSRPNVINILRQASINGLLSVGLTFAILCGGVDISTGALAQAAGMLYALAQGLPLSVAILIPLVFGAGIGTVNGFITNRLRIEPFLATLGMWVFLDGLSLWIGNGLQIIVRGPNPLKFFGQGYLGPIPVPVLLFLGFALISHLVLSHTVFGRILYAIGGNENASYLSGINVVRYRNAAYIISAVLAAVGGIVMVGRLGLADPTVGYGLPLDAVAATVVGGARLGGGRGHMWGTVAGVLLLAVLNNMFNLLNMSSYVQLMAKGIIIVAAVALSRKRGS